MVLKTFNVEKETYEKFSEYCKKYGISMSKQISLFMKSVIDDEPEIREEYIKKLKNIRKQKNIKIGSLKEFKERYS